VVNNTLEILDGKPNADVSRSWGSISRHWANIYGRLGIVKEMSAPGAGPTNKAHVFLDSADGDYKIRFDSGAAVTIAVHP